MYMLHHRCLPVVPQFPGEGAGCKEVQTFTSSLVLLPMINSLFSNPSATKLNMS
jgi:hypothetical protein